MHGIDSNFSNVPAFLVKLWKLVEDSSCDDLISWSEHGNSFVIKDQITFAKELLPQYFKHNNMASFIRQLNMYGFRKLMNFDKGGLKVENNEIEFCNSFFMKGQVQLLECIKRKIPTAKSSPDSPSKPNPKDLLTDLTSIREKQETMNNLLIGMKKENELLWRELSALRKKHKTQEQIIQKVIQFLVSIVQSGKQNIGVKRQMARMLQDSKSPDTKKANMSRQLDVVRGKKPDFFITVPADKLTSPVGPVIHEVTDLDHEERSPLGSGIGEKQLDSVYDKRLVRSSPSSDRSVNSPLSMSHSPEPLSLLRPFESRISAAAEDDEEVLGLPVDFAISSDIPVPDIASVISISENSENVISPQEDQNNVISIPDDENNADSVLGDSENAFSLPLVGKNVISLPEGCDLDETQNVTSITENDASSVLLAQDSSSVNVFQNAAENISVLGEKETDVQDSAESVSNVISIPEVTSPNATDVTFSSDLIPFSPSLSSLFSPKTDKDKTSIKDINAPSPVIRSSFSLSSMPDLDLGSLELHLNKESNQSDSASGKLCTTKKDPVLSCTTKKDPVLSSKPERFDSRSNNLQLTLSDTTSMPPDNAKNALTNHVLEVDDELKWLSNQIQNFDSSGLLEFFSSDAAANNTALATQLTSDSSILRDTDANIIGNELVQFNPALDMTFDENSFLDNFDCAGSMTFNNNENEEQNESSLSYDKVLQNIKLEKDDDKNLCSFSKSSTNTGPSPPKKVKSTRSRGRRKAK